jgi:hypothetical protein
MLNFAEQTGSGAVIVVWSFLIVQATSNLYITMMCVSLLYTYAYYDLYIHIIITYVGRSGA